MVDIKKINDNEIEIDGKNIVVDKYNESLGGWLDDPVVKKYKALYDYFWSRPKPDGDFYPADEYVREIAKNKKVSLNTWTSIKNRLDETRAEINARFVKLAGNISEDSIERIWNKNNDFWQQNKDWFSKLTTDMEQFKSQLEATGNDWGNDYNDPNKDKSPEELQKKAKEIETYRQQAKQEIENALNKDPKITNEELDWNNQNWENSIWNSLLALGEKEIDKIKFRVLTDIQEKRAAKTGQEQKKSNEELKILRREAIREIDSKKNEEPALSDEELERSNPDWRNKILNADNEELINLIKNKVLSDIRNRRDEKSKEKSAFEKIKNSDLNQLDKTQIAEALKAFSIQEGNEGYENDNKTKEAEEKLINSDIELFKKIHIEALKERLKENGIKEEEFAKKNSEYRRFVDNKITKIEEFKKVRDELIKKSGEEGAKSRWQKLFEEAKSLFQKAKNDIRDQIKDVKEKFNSLKKDKNSYSQSYQKNNQNQISNLEKSLQEGKWIETTNEKSHTGKIIAGVLGLGAVSIIGLAIIIKKRNKRVKSTNQEE